MELPLYPRQLQLLRPVFGDITHSLFIATIRHARLWTNTAYLNGFFNLTLLIPTLNPLAHFHHDNIATAPIDKRPAH